MIRPDLKLKDLKLKDFRPINSPEKPEERQQETYSSHPLASFDKSGHLDKDISAHWPKSSRPDRYPLAHLLFQAIFWLLSPKVMIQPNHQPYQPAISRLP
jgi:hypothetical protein